MSDSIKNKIYNFEEIPPTSAWQAIALSLDEKLLQKSTVSKLYNQEEFPPANAWNKILTVLDTNLEETKIRNIVLDQEAVPPPLAWNKIAAELDKQPHESFSVRILEYEVTPPANAWTKISAALDTGESTERTIPLHKKFPLVYRIAAAAAVIGIITWVGFNFLNIGKKDTDSSLAYNEIKTTPTTAPVSKSNQPATTEVTGDTDKGTGMQKQVASIKPENNNPAQPKINKDNQDNSTVDIPAVIDDHTSTDDFAVADNKNLHKKNRPAPSSSENKTDPRYLVYLTEQGEMVKLSKKLADLKCIYTKDGGVSQESLAKLDASECNDQVKYWQDKMAHSSLQSSSNPLELIEVLK